jgi:hypothetical protein
MRGYGVHGFVRYAGWQHRSTPGDIMERSKLVIPEPCPAEWNEMSGDAERRFCNSCQKHVHNLSAMTPQAAARLVEGKPADGRSLCIRYTPDVTGEVRYTARRVPATAPREQVRGARLLQTAALSVLSLFGGTISGLMEEAAAQPHGDESIAGGMEPMEELFMGEAMPPEPEEPAEEGSSGDESADADKPCTSETRPAIPSVAGRLPAPRPPESAQPKTWQQLEREALAKLAAMGMDVEDEVIGSDETP